MTGADGKAFAFQAAQVPSGGSAGLYRAEEYVGTDKLIAGWVVDADGTVAGAVKRPRGPRTVQPLPTGKGPTANLAPGARGPSTGLKIPNPKPPFPGQRVRGTITKIDPTKRTLTVNDGSKNIELPATDIVVVDPKGGSSSEDVRSPRKLRLGIEVEVVVEPTANGGKRIKVTIKVTT